MSPTPDPSLPPLTAVERVEQSRQRIRVWLERASPKRREAAQGEPGVQAKMASWVEDLRAHPLAGAVIDAVYGWWQRHPLHTVAAIANDAVRDVAAPLVRRYPMAVVGGAIVVGAMAAKIRPWRWVAKRALFAGLLSQVAAQLLTQAPLEFILDTLNRFGRPDPLDPHPEAPDEVALNENTDIPSAAVPAPAMQAESEAHSLST
jgi:hypothetical protein